MPLALDSSIPPGVGPGGGALRARGIKHAEGLRYHTFEKMHIVFAHYINHRNLPENASRVDVHGDHHDQVLTMQINLLKTCGLLTMIQAWFSFSTIYYRYSYEIGLDEGPIPWAYMRGRDQSKKYILDLGYASSIQNR